MMLYTTEHANGHAYRLRWSYPGIRILRGAAASYESIASFISSGVSVVSTGPPERLTAEYVEPAYFRVLRVAPALGRVSAAGTPGEPAEVVIGHRLWQSRFAGSGGAIGRTVRVNGVTLTVVGVMPPGFRGLSGDADLWLPETLGPILYYREYLTTPQHFLSVVARLRPGVTPASARRELDVVGARVAAETPPQWDEAADRGATLRPLAEARVDPSAARARWLIFGAALFVLLVASVNVANLLATRLAGRARDVAVRLALGCGRARLLRALWAEVLALSLLGLGAGLLVAAWSNAGVGAVAPAALATPANGYRQLGAFADLRLDGAVLLFALGAALASGFFVSLLAFRRTGRMDARDGAAADRPHAGLQRRRRAARRAGRPGGDAARRRRPDAAERRAAARRGPGLPARPRAVVLGERRSRRLDAGRRAAPRRAPRRPARARPGRRSRDDGAVHAARPAVRAAAVDDRGTRPLHRRPHAHRRVAPRGAGSLRRARHSRAARPRVHGGRPRGAPARRRDQRGRRAPLLARREPDWPAHRPARHDAGRDAGRDGGDRRHRRRRAVLAAGRAARPRRVPAGAAVQLSVRERDGARRGRPRVVRRHVPARGGRASIPTCRSTTS